MTKLLHSEVYREYRIVIIEHEGYPDCPIYIVDNINSGHVIRSGRGVILG